MCLALPAGVDPANLDRPIAATAGFVSQIGRVIRCADEYALPRLRYLATAVAWSILFFGSRHKCFKCDALRQDRDQLFAEAAHQYRAGARWWPTAEFEREHIRPEQDARYDADVWTDTITAWLDEQPRAARITIGDVAIRALIMKTDKIGRTEQNRITGIMIKHGWIRDGRTGRGNVRWVRGPDAPASCTPAPLNTAASADALFD